MRGAAPSVVCPRCGHESPPSGAGRFMTCAKCGMSIDANAGERQQAVRGRVKEKLEVEIDPTLPRTPSKFPLGIAISVAVLITGGIAFVAYQMRRDPSEISAEQRENLRTVRAMQKAFVEVWDAMPRARDAPSCKVLVDIVTKPCRPTVRPSKLAYERAILAISQADETYDCVSAVEAFSKSRLDASCD